MKALADTRLVGGGVPVAFAAGDAPLVRPEPGLAYLPSGSGARLPLHGLELRAAADVRRDSSGRSPRIRRRSSPRAASSTSGRERPRRRSAQRRAVRRSTRWPTRIRMSSATRGSSRSRSPSRDALARRTPRPSTLESWFRKRGGFSYTEHPAVFSGRAARRLRRRDARGLLPVLRGSDGVDAALPRHARARRGRLLERDVRREVRRLDGDRPRRARVGRGLVPRLRLAAVRPDAVGGTAGARRADRGVLVCVARLRPSTRGRDARRARARTSSRQSAHRHGETGPAIDGDRRRRAAAVAAALAEREHRDAVPRRARRGARRDRRDEAGRAAPALRHARSAPRRRACRRELADYLVDQRIDAAAQRDAARARRSRPPRARRRRRIRSSPPQPPRASAARTAPAAPRARARRELRALVRHVRGRLTARASGCVACSRYAHWADGRVRPTSLYQQGRTQLEEGNGCAGDRARSRRRRGASPRRRRSARRSASRTSASAAGARPRRSSARCWS